ncbi:hypothetical protein F7725_016030 [Dissostichus mawsoni]|uniref:Uncharacterized protein n=1 Tax=Dissostichus mawsoni TaxID=36200 RepID=A0A7J5Y3H2_DISMA|nr:hypothetical protein F7725_016030 [Dissostichus mawsoni]
MLPSVSTRPLGEIEDLRRRAGLSSSAKSPSGTLARPSLIFIPPQSPHERSSIVVALPLPPSAFSESLCSQWQLVLGQPVSDLDLRSHHGGLKWTQLLPDTPFGSGPSLRSHLRNPIFGAHFTCRHGVKLNGEGGMAMAWICGRRSILISRLGGGGPPTLCCCCLGGFGLRFTRFLLRRFPLVELQLAAELLMLTDIIIQPGWRYDSLTCSMSSQSSLPTKIISRGRRWRVPPPLTRNQEVRLISASLAHL